MSSKNSQCENFAAMLDAFVDKELDGSEAQSVGEHISGCDDCQRQVKEIEALKSTLSSLPRKQMKFDLADNFDELLAKQTSPVLPEQSNVVAFSGKRKWLVATASAAAVAVIAIAAAIISNDGHQQLAQLHSSETKNVATRDKVDSQNGAFEESSGGKNAPQNLDTQPAKVASSPDPLVTASNAHKTAGAHLSDETERLAKEVQPAPNREDKSSAPVVAQQHAGASVVPAAQSLSSNRPAASEILALYEDDDGISSDIGVSTDEDGLYAIKL